MKLYPDYTKRWKVAAAAAALVTCIGCTDDMGLVGDDFDNTTTPSDCLAFTTRVAPERKSSSASRGAESDLEITEEQWVWQTEVKEGGPSRGTLVQHLSGEAGVLGFQYDDEADKYPIAGEHNNLECVFDGDNLVSKDATILWKSIDKKHLNVYAYTPYVPSTAAENDSMRLDFAAAPPKIDYIVPDYIINQKDILVARWISKEHADPSDYESYKNKTIPLTFNHALTAIRFKIGTDCNNIATVKSVAIKKVYNHGEYDFLQDRWSIVKPAESADTTKQSYTISFGEGSSNPDVLDYEDFNLYWADGEEALILMPQKLPKGAEIVLTYIDTDGSTQVKPYKIAGKVWEPGKLITYTFHLGAAPETIYFDLAAGNVDITESSYSGYVYKQVDNTTKYDIVNITGDHTNNPKKHYYVYQSTSSDDPQKDNRAAIWADGVCKPPKYKGITAPDGRPWSEFITNNPKVESVIDIWQKGNDKIATDVGRSATSYKIHITGNVICDLTIDNIYSVYQERPTYRHTAGIAFIPGDGVHTAKVTVNIIGDNRVGAVHYQNHEKKGLGNEIIFEGTGTLTVADVDAYKNSHEGMYGYYANHWSSAIGSNDEPGKDSSHGIVINSGIIFAGTTDVENCTAIGGGGNAYGKVTIKGGTVTAVATTTGTAIGGGIGFGDPGGEGEVYIAGGNVYAYNHKNKWDIPSSAIGGAGSRDNNGAPGTVIITGGYVYAESGGGTAIGGGSSFKQQGGMASITIKGGEVYAKTGSPTSASIGGGTACTGTENSYPGGTAMITISGNPIIRTGSIGGGGKGIGSGQIGSAKIQISGGDIQAQFILAAGSGDRPTFSMNGGVIRNSNTADTEYLHVKPDGGAVYLEDGDVTIESGTIRNCEARSGGAIYIQGSRSTGTTDKATFTMSGGVIKGNEATLRTDGEHTGGGDGGAVYITNGKVTLTGGTIEDNMAAGGNGGGIFISQGSLKVDGINAVIRDNTSEIRADNGTVVGGNGGGVYVDSKISGSGDNASDVEIKLLSGQITENSADRRGGGLCVIQDSDKNNALITIGKADNPNDRIRITHNHCLLQGGGVYARGAKADITINSGTIQKNTVSQYVHNPNVTNEKGSVTLNGGDVDHIVITFNANDGTDNPPTSIQRIVTETNSELKAPAFTRRGYYLAGWNTKPSGSGDSYTNGQIMNKNRSITLYAQWTRW